MNYEERWKKFKLGGIWRSWETIGGGERDAWSKVQSRRHKILLAVVLALVALVVYSGWGVTHWNDLALGGFLTFVSSYFFGWMLFIPDSPPGVVADD